MIDPVIQMAFAMYSNRGVYALLLGSGVSRSSGIPTGWEITLDLIRKVACLEGKDCGSDPPAWYSHTYSEEPNYSKLLAAIAKSPAERNRLLRGYFEPTEEEREESQKTPTRAHKAIADLVARGFVRVIITTNFDRLIENAIREAGIEPTVVSTSNAVTGMLPLAQTPCLVLKVNGDYLDTRIKNTPDELESYGPPLRRLLNRVFDEYGLIVCGWSGDWDIALNAALQRCRNQRFTTYWCLRDTPTGGAAQLINLRRATKVNIRDADTFFEDLQQKVISLDDVSGPHPLSAKLASETAKRYIAEERYTIRLHDLAVGEADALYKEAFSERYSVKLGPASQEARLQALRDRVNAYESLSEVTAAITLTGCYWGGASHRDTWVKCLERIANPPTVDGSPELIRLRLYPALLLLYAGGIASIAAGKYDTFVALLQAPLVRNAPLGEGFPLLLEVFPDAVLDWQDAGPVFFGGVGIRMFKYPVSEHIYRLLREPLKGLLPDDSSYQRSFDRFEYLRALLNSNLNGRRSHSPRVILGCFAYRSSILQEIETEIDEQGPKWPLLELGLFDRSTEKLKAAKQSLDSDLQYIQKQRW